MFQAMFSHGLRECFEKSVTLYGVKHRAMELVLQYAYMGITKACVLVQVITKTCLYAVA